MGRMESCGAPPMSFSSALLSAMLLALQDVCLGAGPVMSIQSRPCFAMPPFPNSRFADTSTFHHQQRLFLTYRGVPKSGVCNLRASDERSEFGASLLDPKGGEVQFVGGSIDIMASPKECFQVASTYEDYQRWAKSVPKIETLTRNEEGLGRRVALKLGAVGFTLDYILEYEYDQPKHMCWRAVGGKVTTPIGQTIPFEDTGTQNQLVGSYEFEEVRPGLTRAEYKLAIEFGIPFPTAVKTQLEQNIVNTALQELKTYTEDPATKAAFQRREAQSPSARSTEDVAGASFAAPPPHRADADDTEGEERARVKEELMAALEGLDRGFAAGAAEQARVREAVGRLARLSPEARPAERLLSAPSEWRLLYSDAPDIVGPSAAGRGRIGQRIEVEGAQRRIVNLVEAEPPAPLAALPLAVPPPSLELEVALLAEASSASAVRLSLLSTKAYPSPLPAPLPVIPLAIPLPVPLPFGSFSIRYYDGDLRIIETAQGYLGINLRVDGQS